MTLLIRHITVGQAATVINIIVCFFEYTLALAVVALLIYFTPTVHSAVGWNVIGRSLHSSLWPTLLRTDSTNARASGFRVALFSYLSLTVSVLVAIAGVVMPLGLKTGPALSNPPQNISALFVSDASPLALGTSLRGGFFYGRICGAEGPMVCPGSTTGNTSTIAPEVIAKFNATPYGTFGMQFRRYYQGTAGYNYSMPLAMFSTTESLILRSGIFAVDGLIVDMDNPGVGLWNHILPADSPNGATWTEDVLWLEPVTACVDTNLTIDYRIYNNLIDLSTISVYNLTDLGGFFNLTHDYPPLDRDGQNINLLQHAYKGTVLSNAYAMLSFPNLTQNTSHYGRTFLTGVSKTDLYGGQLQLHDMLYLYNQSDSSLLDTPDISTSCQGYGGGDSANISNVAVAFNLFVAPPLRTDGGDARMPGDNSTWTQSMFGCASATRARMQRIAFSFNGSMELSALNIARSDIHDPVLWATEKTELNITDVDVFWGRVPDALEGDPALWTVRSDGLWIPAGGMDVWTLANSGQPSTLPALAWNAIKSLNNHLGVASTIADYTGSTNYALLAKFQNLTGANPTGGPAMILNMIWTDLMANNLLGSDSRVGGSLNVQQNVHSTSYDLRYAVPGFFLFALWVPLFTGAVFILGTGLLRLSHLRRLLTHTGAGRVALGTSALRPISPPLTRTGTDMKDERHWAKGAGRTQIAFQPAEFEAPNAVTPSSKAMDFSALASHESLTS